MLTFLAANLGLQESRLFEAMQVTHLPRYGVSETMQVGLAWHIRDLDDLQIIEHHGATGGYWGFAGFIKDQQIGVVVLTNRSRNRVPEVVSRWTVDRLLGLPEVNWNARYRKEHEALLALERAPEELEPMHQMFRAIHTLKGSAGFIGFDELPNAVGAYIDGTVTGRTVVKIAG